MSAYFEKCEELEELVNALTVTERIHPELDNARILPLLRFGAWKDKGQQRLGSAKKCSALEKFTTGYDFILLIHGETWQNVSQYWERHRAREWKRGLVGHELCHMGKNVDGNWTVYNHEFVGFRKELNHYRNWSETLQEFENYMLYGGQISLDEAAAGKDSE